MEKLGADSRSRAPSMARLGVVYADPLRMKIVTELYLREMSAKQFHEEFGGGSVSRVDRHFKKLAEYGWLKFQRSESGGKRRGATEHFYRAAELVIFDADRWAQLPDSVRASFSLMTFEQLTERVGEAIAAGTFNARSDRHLSWTTIFLDELGWERLIIVMAALFEVVLEEQSSARVRIAECGEIPALITVGLAAFESPVPLDSRASSDHVPAESSGIGSVRTADDSILILPTHLAKVFADPLALQILAEANSGEISPTQFRDEFGGGTVRELNRRFKRLERFGWLRVSDRKTGGRRRGATEHFYRAVGPAVLDNEAWSGLPNSVKTTLSWKTFEQLREKVVRAIATGTFDGRTNRHLSWSLLRLDQIGWQRVIADVDFFFASIPEEEEKARLRMAESGATAIPVTVALTAFESPRDGPKAP